MSTTDPVFEIIRARFASRDLRFLSEVMAFELPIPGADQPIKGKQLSVYQPAFDAVICRSRKHGVILAQNTYLSSFAYNAAAVWLKYGHEHERLASGEESALRRLMRYNLKKFYAEQILRRTRNVFGLAIFLETLLYEQWEMEAILEGPELSDGDKQEHEAIASLMTSLVLFHETGHIYADHVPNFRGELRKALPETFLPVTMSWDAYGEKGQTEFECDALAVLSAVQEKNELLAPAAKLRLIVLGFVLFAALHSLDRSAEETARVHPASEEKDTRGDILGALPGASYVIGTDPFMQERARCVLKLAETLAERDGLDLYSSAATPVLPPKMLEFFEEFVPEIIADRHPQYRGMCEMLARALHGHNDSIDYLVWRSKKFKLPPQDRE